MGIEERPFSGSLLGGCLTGGFIGLELHGKRQNFLARCALGDMVFKRGRFLGREVSLEVRGHGVFVRATLRRFPHARGDRLLDQAVSRYISHGAPPVDMTL
jgi:hypothetical protein